jgi:hypothetical protein
MTHDRFKPGTSYLEHLASKHTNVRLDMIVIEGDFDESTLSDDLLRRHRDMIHNSAAGPGID